MTTTTDFITACHAGRFDEAKSLLAEAEINGANEVGQGALLTFHAAISQFLLENGADPNRQQNESGASVLAGLSYAGEPDCVDLLLAHGADPNLGRMETSETPLHHVMCGNGTDEDKLEIVEALVGAGADPNIRTKTGVASFNFMRDVKVRGETPLHRAAAYASNDVIQALLAAGADRSIRDAFGDSPLSWGSLHMRDSEVLQALCFGDFSVE